jgi:hypothetical protein
VNLNRKDDLCEFLRIKTRLFCLALELRQLKHSFNETGIPFATGASPYIYSNRIGFLSPVDSSAGGFASQARKRIPAGEW